MLQSCILLYFHTVTQSRNIVIYSMQLGNIWSNFWIPFLICPNVFQTEIGLLGNCTWWIIQVIFCDIDTIYSKTKPTRAYKATNISKLPLNALLTFTVCRLPPTLPLDLFCYHQIWPVILVHWPFLEVMTPPKLYSVTPALKLLWFIFGFV